MSRSKVYFTDFHVPVGTSQLEKLRRLIDRAGLGEMDLNNKFVCIKMHFGEPGNLTFLRPNYAKVVADYVKSKGGIPFLCDCNTLYVGRRKNALEHMDAAYENGFSPFSTGCQIIIGDGLKGTDDVEVPVVGGEYVKAAKIGRAVMDADVFISLTHFKGHESTSFGGAIKNIGMGCGSRAGKMEQHNSGKPIVHAEKCVGCHICATHCGQDAITYGEWNAGFSVAGMGNAASSFCFKIGSGLGTAALGWVLAAGAFDAAKEVQGAAALTAITTSFAWIPAVTSALCVVCMIFFDLDKHYDKVVKDLAEGKYRK